MEDQHRITVGKLSIYDWVTIKFLLFRQFVIYNISTFSQGYRGDKMDTYPSRQSLGSILSGESRGSRYLGNYCQTATYRGSCVRYKELYFNDGKCKNMSR